MGNLGELAMKHNYKAQYKNIVLRPLEKRDIEKLRQWRNDEAQTKYLREIGYITPKMQEQWFENYLHNEDEIIFAIEETQSIKDLIGSVALYAFEDNIAEIGKFQIGNSVARGCGYGIISFSVVSKIAFTYFNTKTLKLVVHKENIVAQKVYEKVGFEISGEEPSRNEYKMDLNEEQLDKKNRWIKEIVIQI